MKTVRGASGCSAPHCCDPNSNNNAGEGGSETLLRVMEDEEEWPYTTYICLNLGRSEPLLRNVIIRCLKSMILRSHRIDNTLLRCSFAFPHSRCFAMTNVCAYTRTTKRKKQFRSLCAHIDDYVVAVCASWRSSREISCFSEKCRIKKDIKGGKKKLFSCW